MSRTEHFEIFHINQALTSSILSFVIRVYYTHFEIIGDPSNLISSQRCDLITNCIIFFSANRIHFPTNEEATLKG